jgi:hypothetical protein
VGRDRETDGTSQGDLPAGLRALVGTKIYQQLSLWMSQYFRIAYGSPRTSPHVFQRLFSDHEGATPEDVVFFVSCSYYSTVTVMLTGAAFVTVPVPVGVTVTV